MAEEIETRVAILERDIDQMTGFFTKLDTTMDKLSDVSSSIKELLAVHEIKISQQDDITSNIHTTLKEIKSENKINREELISIKDALVRHKMGFLIIGVLIAFILFKMGIIPWMPPFLN